ncbi:hypothetical protein HB777_23895 [Mesorhizobium loti]|nr:hypothetical protein HB777_23895 [Mesorhizobium loti]
MAKEPTTNDFTKQTLHGKAFQVNENSVEGGEPIGSQAPLQVPQTENSSSKRNRTKLQGKAFQVNENTVEDGEPIASTSPKGV